MAKDPTQTPEDTKPSILGTAGKYAAIGAVAASALSLPFFKPMRGMMARHFEQKAINVEKTLENLETAAPLNKEHLEAKLKNFKKNAAEYSQPPGVKEYVQYGAVEAAEGAVIGGGIGAIVGGMKKSKAEKEAAAAAKTEQPEKNTHWQDKVQNSQTEQEVAATR